MNAINQRGGNGSWRPVRFVQLMEQTLDIRLYSFIFRGTKACNDLVEVSTDLGLGTAVHVHCFLFQMESFITVL